jgi:hypothetical protein
MRIRSRLSEGDFEAIFLHIEVLEKLFPFVEIII